MRKNRFKEWWYYNSCIVVMCFIIIAVLVILVWAIAFASTSCAKRKRATKATIADVDYKSITVKVDVDDVTEYQIGDTVTIEIKAICGGE